MSWASKARIALTPRIWFTKKSGLEDVMKKDEQVIIQAMDTNTIPDNGCWPELKEFCKAHIVECTTFALFLLFGIFSIFNAFGFLGNNELQLRYDHYEQLVTEHCQFVENRNFHGSEGMTDHPNASLISVLAVIRHGDRYGLVMNKECQTLTEQEEKEFNEYLSTLKDQNLKTRLAIPQSSVHMKLAPSNEDCDTGALAPRGAVQEFAMGRFLFSQYKNTSLFRTLGESIKMTVTFSNLQRTFASGVALVSGLLDQNETSFASPIELKEASFYYGCSDPECKCDENIGMLLAMSRIERKGLFRLEMDEKTQYIAQKLSAELNLKNPNIDPVDIIDNVVARYACPRKPLPCDDQYCVSYLFFGDIFEYFSKQSEKLFDLNMGVERQYRVLSAYPILRYLGLMAESDEKQVKLFSSHDTIIGSILRILMNSGKYNDWQVFAARIVFEIYKVNENEKMLRVLYDGNDITSSVKFCKTLRFGLCPVSDLQNFLKNGVFEMAGFKSFEEICQDHRNEFIFV